MGSGASAEKGGDKNDSSKHHSMKHHGASKLATAAMSQVVHFSSKEVQHMLTKFEAVCDSGDAVTRKNFQAALTACGFAETDQEVLDRLFSVFDTNCDSTVNFREFTIGISTIAKGTFEEKLEFAFKAIDKDGAGSIGKDEMLSTLKILSQTCTHFGDEELKQESLEEVVDSIYDEVDVEGNAQLNYREYLHAVARHPNIVNYIMHAGEAAVAPAKEKTEEEPSEANGDSLKSPRDAPETPAAGKQADEAEPAAKEAEPAAEEAAPAAEETAPAAGETAPAAEETAPAAGGCTRC